MRLRNPRFWVFGESLYRKCCSGILSGCIKMPSVPTLFNFFDRFRTIFSHDPGQVLLLCLTVFMVGWAVRGFIAAHQVADARQQIAAAEALTQLFKDQLEFLMQTVADAAPNRTIELKRLELELAKHQAECLRKQRLAHEQKRKLD